jgi:hypothetical protein
VTSLSLRRIHLQLCSPIFPSKQNNPQETRLGAKIPTFRRIPSLPLLLRIPSLPLALVATASFLFTFFPSLRGSAPRRSLDEFHASGKQQQAVSDIATAKGRAIIAPQRHRQPLIALSASDADLESLSQCKPHRLNGESMFERLMPHAQSVALPRPFGLLTHHVLKTATSP